MRTFTIISTLAAFSFGAIASTIPLIPSPTVPGATIHNDSPVMDLGAEPHVKTRDTATTFAGIMNTLMSEVFEPANRLGYITAANYTVDNVGASLDNISQAISKATTSLNALGEQDAATIFQNVDDSTESLSASQVADLVGNVLKATLSAIGNANSAATPSQLASTLPALLSLTANIFSLSSSVINLANDAFENFVLAFSVTLQSLVGIAFKQILSFLSSFIKITLSL